MKNRVFVMGGNSSIAYQLVLRLLQDDTEVVVAGRNLSILSDMYAGHPGVFALEARATDSGSVNGAFAQLEAEGRGVNGYAHCVGSILLAPLTKTTDEQIRAVLEVNLMSAMFGLRAFLQHCKKTGAGGAAVLVSTCATGIGVANHEAIAAAKAGVEGLARSAAASHAADGIRVNVVAPGLTDTPMASAFVKSDMMRAASAKQYPLAGVNSAAEVAQAMHWLLSDASNRVTGTILNVDGGFRNIRPLVK